MQTLSYQTMLKWPLTALLLLGLSGCAAAPSEPAENANNQPHEDVVTLTVAVQDYTEWKALDVAIGQYEQDHPGIRIELTRLPGDRYDEFLHMMMTSGQGPDLFHASTEWISTYLYKNWLLDLSEWVEPDVLTDYPDWAVDYTRENSRFYAIPSEASTLRLVYNKELFLRAGLDPEQPPATLDELVNYAANISRAGQGYRIYGFALPAGENGPLQQALEAGSTRSGRYYYRYRDGSYDFTVYVPWFERMLDMKQQGGMFPGETSLSMNTALTQFAEGNIGMMHMTNREYAALLSMMENQSQLGVALPPVYGSEHGDAGALMLTLQAPLAVHNHTLHKEEAVGLWQALHASIYREQLLEEGFSIPLQRQASPERIRSDYALSEFQPGPGESPYPQEPNFIMENRAASGLIQPGGASRIKVYKDVLLGVEPPQEALSALTEQYNRSLENAVYRGLINREHFVYPDFDPLHPMVETK
ncbi:ABC transporter substrate-binding protein [Paenibacillus sp. 1P07SE]|uniref:ABC transporter substrate-binding protein n=1 Tax=Paenibacillus sp. 1P07SE TaxID=3132209 RepID=UPI0039A64EAA